MIDPNNHVLEYVDAYLHDLLSAEEAKALEQHCASCKICQAAMVEARQRFEALKSLAAIEAPEQLIRAAQSRIERYRQRRFRPALVGWAAAAVFLLMFAGLHVYYFTLVPSSYDLKILGQNQFVAQSGASIRVVLVNHNTGLPIEGVPVDIDLTDRKDNRKNDKPERSIRLVSFTTDQWGSGSPQFKLPDWESGEYELQVSASPGKTVEKIVRTVKLKRSWQVMLTSDKPVYRPGQTIRVRSLALAQPDLKPVAGHNVSFAIRDPKGNVIFRKQDVTSRFGIASADCPLADEIIEGAYQIESQVGDTASAATVEVKKYVLPKFKIDISLDRPYYQPGQKVRGTVDARYFFGKPVENAEVEIAVDAGDCPNFLGNENGTVPFSTIYRTQLRTNAKGSAAFEFTVPERLVGREQLSGDASISIRATVVDSAGQKIERSVSRVVTAQPIHIEVIPESEFLVKGVTNIVYLFTRYPDGRPAQTRITISDIHRELSSNRLGVTRVELTPESEKIKWTIRATDAEGKSGSREVVLKCGQINNDFLVRTDAAVYDGGQTMHIRALGSGIEPVFLDLIKDGQTMLTDLIPIKDGLGEYNFDLPPGLFGTIELSAYRYASSGLPVRKTQVIYVRQAKTVKIETTLDRKEYRPGGRAKISFKLTDDQHRPMPGALSLAAVDEAVFSVLSQQPGMERAFFTLEQELLKPVYAIYPWSPDMLPDATPAERAGLEKALFSRAGKDKKSLEAMLGKFMENYAEGNMRMLEVLQRPDSEELMERVSMSDDAKAFLRSIRGKAGIYSLEGTTYPAKAKQAEQEQKKVSSIIVVIWVCLAMAVFIATLIYLLSKLGSGLMGALILIVCFFIFIAFLLPAVQPAREAARRVSAINEIKQLSLAADNAKNEKKLPDFNQETQGTGPIRVRQWFPETLLWRPELITDDEGRATLDLDLADSITTWRLSASAVTAAGQLGAEQSSIRVFQPFFVDLNLPVALTRGDEVAVPVVIYNYLDKPQTVELTLAEGKWFKLLGDSAQKIEPARGARGTEEVVEKTPPIGPSPSRQPPPSPSVLSPTRKYYQKLELSPGEVRSVGFRIRVEKVGRFEFEVTARGSDLSDAVKRSIEVLPDGKRVEQVFNGTLQKPAEIALSVPPQAIEGSVKMIVKIYPSSFSQVVEGLDAIFQRPYGCFEQTSSTTYPNVLALEYLRTTKKSLLEVEAKAQQYIHLGYQRLLGFEIAGGGFDWFGNPPANRTLSAYGLMEFEDMARVHDVDPKLIERTRKWLLGQRLADGSWSAEGHRLHEDPTGDRSDSARLGTTAYIAWAVFNNGKAGVEASETRAYLKSHWPNTINDPYVLALVANALLAMNPDSDDAVPYLDRLDGMKHSSDAGKLVWWDSPSGRTMFYGAGRSGSVETTSLAAMAMLKAGRHPTSTRGALTWIVGQRDGCGTWHSTQATVLALKALLASTGRPLADGRPMRVEIGCDGKPVRELTVPASQSDVVQQIDLSSLVMEGKHTLSIADRGDSAAVYQVLFRYHVPEIKEENQTAKESLSIEIAYDKTELSVNDTVTVRATVGNRSGEAAPMVILDLPIPAGFAAEADDFEKMMANETIAKYQLTPRSAVVYLRQLSPDKPLVLKYRLRATMPVKIAVPPARAYEYYNPDRQVTGGATSLTVIGVE